MQLSSWHAVGLDVSALLGAAYLVDADGVHHSPTMPCRRGDGGRAARLGLTSELCPLCWEIGVPVDAVETVLDIVRLENSQSALAARNAPGTLLALEYLQEVKTAPELARRRSEELLTNWKREHPSSDRRTVAFLNPCNIHRTLINLPDRARKQLEHTWQPQHDRAFVLQGSKRQLERLVRKIEQLSDGENQGEVAALERDDTPEVLEIALALHDPEDTQLCATGSCLEAARLVLKGTVKKQ